jgi:hypothetical protein
MGIPSPLRYSIAFEKISCLPAGSVVAAVPLPDSKVAVYSKVMLAVVEPRFVSVSSVVKKAEPSLLHQPA